jgi:ComF family protein
MDRGKKSSFSLLRRFLGDLLDFVYPPRCGVCGRELSEGEGVICDACWRSLDGICPPFCQKCGLPLPFPNNLCSSCEGRSHHFFFARSYGLFDEIFQKIIHLFKYRRKLSLAGPLSELMAKTMRTDPRFSVMEAMMPVPLHPAKRRSRGYNQSELLARDLSRTAGLPLLREALIRTVNTPSQSRLSLSERMANVGSAFWAKDSRCLQDRRIILVDDVLTTGSTADACARALLEAGAAQISVITVARAAEPGFSLEKGKGQP